jgi:hypothetical protein
MAERSRVIPVQVKENVTVLIEARAIGGEQEVSTTLFDFQGVADTIEAITESLAATIAYSKVFSLSHSGRKPSLVST